MCEIWFDEGYSTTLIFLTVQTQVEVNFFMCISWTFTGLSFFKLWSFHCVASLVVEVRRKILAGMMRCENTLQQDKQIAEKETFFEGKVTAILCAMKHGKRLQTNFSSFQQLSSVADWKESLLLCSLRSTLVSCLWKCLRLLIVAIKQDRIAVCKIAGFLNLL